jgi:hypothetical protein
MKYVLGSKYVIFPFLIKWQSKFQQTIKSKNFFYLYWVKFFVFLTFFISGFGHLAPETWQGKLFCIFYSLLGVPINGILIGSLGTFFGSKVMSFFIFFQWQNLNKCTFFSRLLSSSVVIVQNFSKEKQI